LDGDAWPPCGVLTATETVRLTKGPTGRQLLAIKTTDRVADIAVGYPPFKEGGEIVLGIPGKINVSFRFILVDFLAK
jgi:hypothetical protein